MSACVSRCSAPEPTCDICNLCLCVYKDTKLLDGGASECQVGLCSAGLKWAEVAFFPQWRCRKLHPRVQPVQRPARGRQAVRIRRLEMSEVLKHRSYDEFSLLFKPEEHSQSSHLNLFWPFLSPSLPPLLQILEPLFQLYIFSLWFSLHLENWVMTPWVVPTWQKHYYENICCLADNEAEHTISPVSWSLPCS